MPRNKFSRSRTHPGTPPVCKSKKPLPPTPPYPHPPPYWSGSKDPHLLALLKYILPPVPSPPYETIRTRNLLYHVYPHRSNNVWLDNVHAITARWNVFNGRRLIAIATGPDLVDPLTVQYAFPNTAEFYFVPNDPRLREAASFHVLLRALRNTSCNQATFYAHTKGAAPTRNHDHKTSLGIKLWRHRMYTELLDSWTKIQHILTNHATVGCFKIDYSNIPDHHMTSPTGCTFSKWHYGGTFFWFRHDCVFRNPHWTNIPDDTYAAEMWLGEFINSELAATVYQHCHPTHHPGPNLYDPETHLDPTIGGPIS